MPECVIPLALNAGYEIRSVADPAGLVILLHGYQQKGRIIFSSLHNCFDEGHVILAPDALFPVSVRTALGNHLGFSWYFYDPETDVYFYEMRHALKFLKVMVDQLGFGHLPKTVVGYSQGGYLAPFLGRELERVGQVIGINCRFRSECLRPPVTFRLDGIHGERDQMVDPVRSRRCHRELMEMGLSGGFTLVPDSGHGISGRTREALKECLAWGRARPGGCRTGD